jgi:hypothetical protein
MAAKRFFDTALHDAQEYGQHGAAPLDVRRQR